MSAIEQIQNLLARGFVTVSHGAKKMRELQAEFLAGEVRDNLEHIEPYGFSSEPIIAGNPEAFALFFDGDRSHGVVFCVADRKYRITNMKSGEVAIFDDQGQKVYLKRDEILVETPKNLIATVGGQTVVTSGGNCTITAPLTKIVGPLTVTGLITGQGGMTVSGGGGAAVAGDMKVTSGDVTADGISLKSHVHTGDSGGTTGTAR
jgi:phage baseplate assembly protein V